MLLPKIFSKENINSLQCDVNTICCFHFFFYALLHKFITLWIFLQMLFTILCLRIIKSKTPFEFKIQNAPNCGRKSQRKEGSSKNVFIATQIKIPSKSHADMRVEIILRIFNLMWKVFSSLPLLVRELEAQKMSHQPILKYFVNFSHFLLLLIISNGKIQFLRIFFEVNESDDNLFESQNLVQQNTLRNQ